MTSTEFMPTRQQIALANVVVDIEKTAARAGWDHAPSLYALVPTQDLLERSDLPVDVKKQLKHGWDGSAEHLSAIIQDDLYENDLEDILGHLAWPEEVAGAAVSVERVVVPPQVEEEAPTDPELALQFIQNHPARTDVRLVAGVLRTGQSWSAVRSRSHDSDDKVGQGSALAPSLTEALLASFAPQE
ncbi:PPA1309 family protein [Schaalia sp. lx-100]|uniref:PPA1309 family protein n=1 Tax=Schaalia sp. lx-100 TaxID=2899081 RepID=UPI001E4C0170|nr:PPA1309 family protein [Schaalia sp. lx-100]MCD4556780.1 hypothetical protein [Schaalia sp. lx-100]